MDNEAREKRLQALRDTWYIIRVLTGAFLHVFMILCAFAWAEHTVLVLNAIPHQTDPVSHKFSQEVHFLVGIAVVAAGMAGANWVKSMYVRHVLPEVMDDITKKIVEK